MNSQNNLTVQELIDVIALHISWARFFFRMYLKYRDFKSFRLSVENMDSAWLLAERLRTRVEVLLSQSECC